MIPSPRPTYLQPTREAGGAFLRRGLEGPVAMLNLLRFRAVADYAEHPELAGPEPISGAEAFDRYIAHTLPFLRASGGELLFVGDAGRFLIGPPDESWDLAMLVRHASVSTFLAFEDHDDYLAGLGHRTAAIEDARLLPLTDREGSRDAAWAAAPRLDPA